MDDGSEQVEELTLEPGTVVRSHRPRALWGVLAAVAVVTGALVVTSAGDDGTQRPGLPVALGSASGRQEGAMAADSMPVWVTYVAGDDLPALGGEATAYRLSGTVDESQVRELADALGLDGAVEPDGPGSWFVAGEDGRLDVFAGGGAFWSYYRGGRGCAEADAGTVDCAFGEATLCVDSAAGRGCEAEASGSSSSAGSAGCVAPPDDAVTNCIEPTTTTYVAEECTANDGPAECITDECSDPAGDCAVGCDATAPCGTVPPVSEPSTPGCAEAKDPPCPDDPAPVDLPAEDEARRIALAVIAASGADVDDARVTVDGPADAWYVTVEPVVDGVPSSLLASVAVGPEGNVLSANGYLGQPEALGDYPRLATRAVIDRFNAQSGGGVGIEPAIGDRGTTGGTDTGGTSGDDPVMTTGAPVPPDPCTPPDGASDGCGGGTGGSTDCTIPEGELVGCIVTGVVDGPSATTIPLCKVQPDGSEICEFDSCIESGSTDGVHDLPCHLPACPPTVPPGDPQLGAPESIECPAPEPVPDPTPIEITLVDAEPALVLLPATDGSADAYLVPAYRFTDADGGRVDLPAVADEALTTPPTTDTVEPPVTPTVAPQPCGEPLVEADASGSTHTVQPNRDCVDPDPQTLEEGQEPEIGVGYYADVDTECEALRLGDTVWILDEGDLTGWADPGERHEGGTFTLDSPEHGTFVGDYQGITTATFRLPTATEQIANCDPVPRG